MKTKKTLWSIGYSNKSIKEFIEKLKENGITDLVDVRTYPIRKVLFRRITNNEKE